MLFNHFILPKRTFNPACHTKGWPALYINWMITHHSIGTIVLQGSRESDVFGFQPGDFDWLGHRDKLDCRPARAAGDGNLPLIRPAHLIRGKK